jgi:hypothetical protein
MFALEIKTDILIRKIKISMSKQFYGVFIPNGVGGYLEEYVFCCNDIDDIYNHFLKMKDKCTNDLTLEINRGFYDKNLHLIEEDLKFDISKTITNEIYNGDNFFEDMSLTSDIFTKNDGNVGNEGKENVSITECVVIDMICWYCKKFKLKIYQIEIQHIREIFEKYNCFMDGIDIRKLDFAFYI